MAIFSAQSCCDTTLFDIIEVPAGLGGGSVGDFFFASGVSYYGCWELLTLLPSTFPPLFTATTGPYTSCTECRETNNNECSYSLTSCDDSMTYYGITTGVTLNINDYYYLEFFEGVSTGCYQVKSLEYNNINAQIQFVDGPFVDCPDCTSGASTSYFYNFSSCCSNFNFLLTDIPTTLSFGDVYYVESDQYSGCAQVISATPTSNIFSAISLSLEVDCESCISTYPCKCELTDFCFNTSFSAYTVFNGTYSASCCYNSNTFYTNTGGTAFVFYDGNKWCLSKELGGGCILHGNSPCQSLCPDLCEEYFFEGICPTTTTTTSPCNVFDFDGIFDCLLTSPPLPTPTPTPTIPPTSTPLPTPTPTVCNVNFTYSATSIPDPTPTITPTPTPTPSPDLPVGGSVQFSLFDQTFKCPVTKKLFDCIENRYYYVNEALVFEGQDIMTGETFGGFINGKQSCLTFDGISTISSNSILENIFAVYGFGCNTCQPFVTTTLPPPGCDGVLYNMVQTPYDFVTNGNIIFPETSNPGATEGILNPNTFVVNSVNFSIFDSLGNSQILYFSGLTGNSFNITFSQGSNSVIYSGEPYTFLSLYNTILYSPTITSGLVLVQSSDTFFNLYEPVCVSYESLPPIPCDCTLYQLGLEPLVGAEWDYITCDTGQIGNLLLTGKDYSRRVCAKTGTPSTSTEGLNPIVISECCNLDCITYSATNNSESGPQQISFVDCNKTFIILSLPIGTTDFEFCALENSVTHELGITINTIGPCTI